MPMAPPPYAPELREEAVRLVQSSVKRPSEVDMVLSVGSETLRTLVKRHQNDDGCAAGLTTAERDELRKRRREKKTLRDEREIPAEAAAFSARETQ